MFFRAAAFRADAFAARFLGGEVGGSPPTPTPPVVTPSGGWISPPGYDRHETAEMRRLERERLGIIPKQQRAIDRAAVRIAASVPTGGLLAAPTVMQAPAFDKLLAALRPTEGMVNALVLAILDRVAWMTAEAEEEEAVVRLMFELD